VDRSSLKKLQYLLEYFGYRLIEFFAAYLPQSLLIPKASFIAFLIFHVLRIRREVSLENLRIAFPEKSEKERSAIAYASYKHFCLMILEFMRLTRWSPKQLEKMVEFESTRILEKLMNENKGIIINAAHFGNWEISVSYFSAFWMPTTGVQQKQKNPYIDRRMAAHRNRWGMEIIYSRGAVKNGVNALKQKRMLGLLGDQDGGAKGIFVPFFGKMASTPPGPALIRAKSGAPIAFAYAIRVGKFQFRLGIEPLNIDNNFESSEENLKAITRAYLEVLEKYIRQYPEQYFWMHRRWKTAYPKSDHQKSDHDV
jgi:KDO2-lipid IV(A) lauroyltransferase